MLTVRVWTLSTSGCVSPSLMWPVSDSMVKASRWGLAVKLKLTGSPLGSDAGTWVPILSSAGWLTERLMVSSISPKAGGWLGSGFTGSPVTALAMSCPAPCPSV